MTLHSPSAEPFRHRSRALAKTVLYRVVMVAITVVATLAVTGDPGAALQVGLVANLIKTGTYYGYERLWDRIAWGIEVDG